MRLQQGTVRTLGVVAAILVAAACEQGPVTGGSVDGLAQAVEPDPEPDPEPEPEPEPESPHYGPCANGACAEDPTIIGFLYATDLLIAISEDKGWPACQVDTDDQEEMGKLADLYRWLTSFIARVPSEVTMPAVDARMEELDCQWVGWGEQATVYNHEPRVDGGSVTTFVLASNDPANGVRWEFSMVQLWSDRFEGEWWPQAFLCLVDMPGVTPDWLTPPRRCTRVVDGNEAIFVGHGLSWVTHPWNLPPLPDSVFSLTGGPG